MGATRWILDAPGQPRLLTPLYSRPNSWTNCGFAVPRWCLLIGQEPGSPPETMVGDVL
jgi:hypothetical protein